MRLLVKGKLKESYFSFIGAFIRIGESIRDVIRKPTVTCNYCGWKGYRFKTLVSTVNLSKNAVCPNCLSLERHRKMLEVFKEVKNSMNLSNYTVLDIAPNIAFSNYCKAQKDIVYLSVDLQSQFAMKHMDIQNLDLSDETFDVIICYHVLDYVTDDLKGMREILRVLKKNGIAITQEGINFEIEKTIEWGKPIAHEKYRIRQYGKDFFERWQKAGFKFYHIKENNILISGKTAIPNVNISV